MLDANASLIMYVKSTVESQPLDIEVRLRTKAQIKLKILDPCSMTKTERYNIHDDSAALRSPRKQQDALVHNRSYLIVYVGTLSQWKSDCQRKK